MRVLLVCLTLASIGAGGRAIVDARLLREPPSAEATAREITIALARDPAARAVVVSGTGTHVVLVGTVPDAATRQRVVRVASFAPGVASVDDRVRVTAAATSR